MSATRNFICSIVFIDVVEFSKKSVADQMRIKDDLNRMLAQALKDVPTKDRIILDTGDGAAVSFLGDPEEGLYLGLALRDAVAAGSSLRLRTGINLGPVRLVKDINNQPNIIGDGINVAQRVMSFAETGQVLVSRSYYEVVSALSSDYARLFSYGGPHTDKHVREHEVYVMGDAPAPQRAPRAKSAHAAAFEKLGNTASTARLGVMRRPKLATALTVVLILLVAVWIRLTFREDAGLDLLVDAATPDTTETRYTAPPRETAPPKAQPSRKAEAPQAEPEATTGTLRLSVLPWGEIYVDGRKFGVSPPLRDVALKPGQHRIEIRNPGFASYVQLVEVRAGEEIRIRHRFQ